MLKALVLHSGQCVNYEQMIAEAWAGISVSKQTVEVTVGEVLGSLAGPRFEFPKIELGSLQNLPGKPPSLT